MKKVRLIVVTAVASAVLGCGSNPAFHPADGVSYVVTIPPLRAILSELTNGRATVTALLGPSASPHTYEPRPADAKLAHNSLALFYVADSHDGWAADLSARHRIPLFDLVPEPDRRPWPTEFGEADHDHTSGYDTHFYTDPRIVANLVPRLVEELTRQDPEGKAVYESNGQHVQMALKQLDADLSDDLAQVKGRSVILFHPSFDYFLARYGIDVAGYVELNPGTEASPQHLKRLIELVRERDVKAILTEPQLARRPAEVLSEATGTPLFELDPIGGVEGRMSYAEYLRYNAKILREALQ